MVMLNQSLLSRSVFLVSMFTFTSSKVANLANDRPNHLQHFDFDCEGFVLHCAYYEGLGVIFSPETLIFDFTGCIRGNLEVGVKTIRLIWAGSSELTSM